MSDRLSIERILKAKVDESANAIRAKANARALRAYLADDEQARIKAMADKDMLAAWQERCHE